jgi:hypothetical protein
MQMLTVLSILWVASVAVFALLMMYRANLTNHETDELFLGDHDDESNRKHEHDDILHRVNRLKPYCQGAGGAAVVMTIALVGVEMVRIAAMAH